MNGSTQNDIHVLHASCDVPRQKRKCSHGADLLTLGEYRINKHFTRSSTSDRPQPVWMCMNTWCILLGTHY